MAAHGVTDRWVLEFASFLLGHGCLGLDRSALKELHFITPIDNLPSILRDGILSHRLASSRPHVSIAMPEVQAIRAAVKVPDGSKNGRPLHTYANLYLDARNPMMFVRKAEHESTCVLCIDPVVVDIPGVMVADGNAGSRGGYTLFSPYPSGLKALDADMVFAKYWTDDDYFAYCERKRKRCAEILVPDRVPPEYIVAVRVSGPAGQGKVAAIASRLTVHVDPYVFFR
jgi:hypothetical protein